jgi:TRAP-type transport system periplasmic protein
LFPDVATTRKAFDAWTEKVLLRNEDKVGGRVLGSFGWAGQMLFARRPVEDIANLKGMKIRVTSRSMSDYISALGGVPVTISLDELYTGLQQGTVDGATTAAAVGYGMKLYETTKNLVDLNIGTPTGLLVIHSGTWAKLPADMQGVLTAVGKELTERGWQQSMSLEKTGIEENRTKNVVFQPIKPEWKPALANAQKVTAQRWAERAGAEGKTAFNDVLSPFTGFKLS